MHKHLLKLRIKRRSLNRSLNVGALENIFAGPTFCRRRIASGLDCLPAFMLAYRCLYWYPHH